MSCTMPNSSVSISVSDDDSDEHSKMRVKVRRKRKKPSFRAKNDLTRLLFRTLVKWWPLFLFILAAGLLIFEASRIGRKPGLEIGGKVMNSELLRKMKNKDSGMVKKSDGNLDRLDPTFRVVGGVKERCLKILPPEDLQHLDIPMVSDPGSVVKNVMYLSESVKPYQENNSTISQQHTEATRFNSFTGYPSLVQREESFQVNETTAVHCGFHEENGGFKISDEDKEYLQKCKVVVSTCAFGGGDDLYQPIGMSEASLNKVCYVAFWDEVTLAAQELEGRRVGEDHFIGKWRIVVVKNLPFQDQRLNGKIPKVAKLYTWHNSCLLELQF